MEGTPTPIQCVLDLFATELADVRFADVDAPTLLRLAAEVEMANEAVTSAQAVRDMAQADLKERQKVLLEYVQRALAYARVYAENNDLLSARLEAIALPRVVRRKVSEDTLVLSPGPQSEPAENRRPRKVRSPEPTLASLASSASLED